MSLVEHAQEELSLAGWFDEDSDYGGLIGNAVLELVETFARQRHSGMSAQIVVALFDRVVQYKPLTELTNNRDEWTLIDEEQAGMVGLWQSRRDPRAFSRNAGDTYYYVDAPMVIIRAKRA